MFRVPSCPSSGDTTAVAASGLPIVIRDTVYTLLLVVKNEDFSRKTMN
jgi:hypothetical protein